MKVWRLIHELRKLPTDAEVFSVWPADAELPTSIATGTDFVEIEKVQMEPDKKTVVLF